MGRILSRITWQHVCMGMMGYALLMLAAAGVGAASGSTARATRVITVPADGLRFIAEDGQLLMMLVRDQGQRPALMLYGPDGTATIALVADNAGGLSFLSLAGRPDEEGSTFGIAQLRSDEGHGELRLTDQDTGELTVLR